MAVPLIPAKAGIQELPAFCVPGPRFRVKRAVNQGRAHCSQRAHSPVNIARYSSTYLQTKIDQEQPCSSGGVIMRRLDGGAGAAPADVPRKPSPGGLGRPSAPITRGRHSWPGRPGRTQAKARGIRGASPVRPCAEAVPGTETVAVERREACAFRHCSPAMPVTYAACADKRRHTCPRAVRNFEGASCGAPLPRYERTKKETGAPEPDGKPGCGALAFFPLPACGERVASGASRVRGCSAAYVESLPLTPTLSP
jgi:hypothetical protein